MHTMNIKGVFMRINNLNRHVYSSFYYIQNNGNLEISLFIKRISQKGFFYIYSVVISYHKRQPFLGQGKVSFFTHK